MGRQASPHRRTTRRPLAGALALLAGALVVTGAAAPAAADEHEHATVTSIDLAEPLEVAAADQPEQYAAVRAELAWLTSREGDAPEPDSDTLGPQYTAELHTGDVTHRFHLYPLAEGGPRVFRPAEQPEDRSVDEAWFYARLSLPETLQELGVPLTGDPAVAGAGGGQTPAETEEPEPDSLEFLDPWREGMLLVAGLAVALLCGVASLAFLLHRER